MKERIRQLMEAQHMNQQTFAQLTGIGAASLSSIFNGRTEPTLRHVEAIRKKFPNINLDWLLTGSGGMFVPASTPDDASSSSMDNANGVGKNGTDILAEGMLDFGSEDEAYSAVQPSVSSSNYNASKSAMRQNSPASHQSHSSRQPVIAMQSSPSRRITEIRVFYDDQTWESFVPKK